jgi:carbon-monoxide dehydrogenase medium subunit
MGEQGDRKVLLAESIGQALQWKAEHGAGARFAGGGTDLLLQTRSGRLKPEVFIRLPAVAPNVTEDGDYVVLPALSTLSDLAAHPGVRAHVPVLAEAMLQIGSPQIRNVATLAGNLCNASPAADSAPVLLVSQAVATLASVRGTRAVPLDELFLGPGKTALAADELLLEVRLRRVQPGERVFFRKFGPRGANVISSASFAARIRMSGTTVEQAFLAAGSVGPRPLRLRNTEAALTGYPLAGWGGSNPPEALAEAVRKDISPMSDVRGSGWYKGEVIERCLAWLGERLAEGGR